MAFDCLIQGGADRSQGFGCTGVWIEPGCGTCAHFHSGWDLAAPCGREVYASCDGVVVGIGDDPGYGPFAVFLQRYSDGLVELYGHLQDAMVRIGQQVQAHQLLGHVGTMGNSTGCHVHYSVRPTWNRFTECDALDPGPYICGCAAGVGGPQGQAPPAPRRSLTGLEVLYLMGFGPGGAGTYSPGPSGR
jgi:murein DD-endopeptidase MepM/ murein hydrolase activator NlpD